MMPCLVIQGGSSPFAVALIDALAGAGREDAGGAAQAGEGGHLPPMGLRLLGRDLGHLAAVGRYAVSRLAPLGWHCEASNDAERALDGADVVLHQIRYGGLAARAAGEQLCQAHGLAADETLGPAALLTALAAGPAVQRNIALLQRRCPDAWVLNLTNPLSWVTVQMARALPRCIGLCELPQQTADAVAATLGLPRGMLDWHYQGLNHRGFITGLRCAGMDPLPRLVETLRNNAASGQGPATIGGIGADAIERLGAVPLKYFRLLEGGVPPEPGRAGLLTRLRHQIVQQLRHRPGHTPPASLQRHQPWYEQAVVPALQALCGVSTSTPSIQVVNRLHGDGLVREERAAISRGAIRAAPVSAAGTVACHGAAAVWLERLEQHERASLRALDQPCSSSLRDALMADPTIPASGVDALLASLCERLPAHRRIDHAVA